MESWWTRTPTPVWLSASLAAAAAAGVWYASRSAADPFAIPGADLPAFEPLISLARFRPHADVDPISYGAGAAHVHEFSRQYQVSFTGGCDPHAVVRRLSRARLGMQREFHALRMWLENDARKERAVLQGISETDATMAIAMADVARRFPEVRLAHGAGAAEPGPVRAAGDSWT